MCGLLAIAETLWGQTQLALKAHSTKHLTIRKALRLDNTSAKGWLGVISSDDHIQFSYRHLHDHGNAVSESLDALEWTTENRLRLKDSDREELRVSSPNLLPAQVSL